MGDTPNSRSSKKENNMPRSVTISSGQWWDVPFVTLCAKMAEFGYDGIELACWGDHFDVERALNDDAYVGRHRNILEKHGLKCFAISNHNFFAEMWNPVLDIFQEEGVKFALEVHPTEIAFDIVTSQKAVDAIGGRKEFGFNYDPSHLGYQGVDYVDFIRMFGDRIYHAHMKDAYWSPTPTQAGVFGGHLEFGDPLATGTFVPWGVA
jgi:sugar phosphate isomerase/epimerase